MTEMTAIPGGYKTPEYKQTLGEYRVGIDFNPSAHEGVNQVKRMAANFIDVLENYKEGQYGEVLRLLSHAQTLVEDAAMNGVKAITKKPRA